MSESKYYRLGLTFFLIVAVSTFWYTRLDELYYHTISSGKLVDLGEAVDVSSKQEELKPNTYVRVSGVLGNKAATLRGLRVGSLRYGRYQVRNILGSKLFIEFDQDKYQDKFNNPFTRIDVTGRLVDFSKTSELTAVRDFFEQRYKSAVDENAMLIVVDEKPRGEIKYSILFFVTLLLVSISIYHSVKGFIKKS